MKTTGTFWVLESLGNTRNGNTRWLCVLIHDVEGVEPTVIRTKPNSDVGGSVRNYHGRQVEAEYSAWRNQICLDSIRTMEEAES